MCCALPRDALPAAYDHCRAKNMDWTDCRQHACSEIRAASLSGGRPGGRAGLAGCGGFAAVRAMLCVAHVGGIRGASPHLLRLCAAPSPAAAGTPRNPRPPPEIFPTSFPTSLPFSLSPRSPLPASLAAPGPRPSSPPRRLQVEDGGAARQLWAAAAAPGVRAAARRAERGHEPLLRGGGGGEKGGGRGV